MLVRSGLPSRDAAKKVVDQMDPFFLDRNELRSWLKSDAVIEQSKQPDWPSAATSSLWSTFMETFATQVAQGWSKRMQVFDLTEPAGFDDLFRIEETPDGQMRAYSPDYRAQSGIMGLELPAFKGLVFGQHGLDGNFQAILIGPP